MPHRARGRAGPSPVRRRSPAGRPPGLHQQVLDAVRGPAEAGAGEWRGEARREGSEALPVAVDDAVDAAVATFRSEFDAAFTAATPEGVSEGRGRARHDGHRRAGACYAEQSEEDRRVGLAFEVDDLCAGALGDPGSARGALRSRSCEPLAEQHGGAGLRDAEEVRALRRDDDLTPALLLPFFQHEPEPRLP